MTQFSKKIIFVTCVVGDKNIYDTYDYGHIHTFHMLEEHVIHMTQFSEKKIFVTCIIGGKNGL